MMMPRSMTRSEIRPPRLTDDVGELAPPQTLAHVSDKDAQALGVQLLGVRRKDGRVPGSSARCSHPSRW